MNYLLSFIFLFVSICSFSQTSDAKRLFLEGKREFEREFKDQDYNRAAKLLEQAVKLEPNNAEYRYFLGYAYSRINSKNGGDIPNMRLDLVYQSSVQFETVNKLMPKYEGEKIILDPYSKIAAEWGSLAMKYDACHQPDSVVWALKEGHKRGGFGDFHLSLLRGALDFCTPGSFLFAPGDNFAFPILYLQKVENYRPDVVMVLQSMLETKWYPDYLQDQYELSFGRNDVELDSLNYCYCTDSLIQIPVDNAHPFSWVVGGRENYYLYRGDRLFLDLLKCNQFKREVFHCMGFPKSDFLDLDNYQTSFAIVVRLNYDNRPQPKDKEFEAQLRTLLDCMKYIDVNRADDLFTVSMLRERILLLTNSYVEQGNFQLAKHLIKLIDEKLPVALCPMTKKSQIFYEKVLQEIEENYPLI